MSKLSLINFIQSNISNITVTQNGLETIVENFEEVPFAKVEYLLKQEREQILKNFSF